MIHAEFAELIPGDRVMFDNNKTVYTVTSLGSDMFTVFAPDIRERTIFLSPNDDDYVRKVGMFDEDAKRMHRIE